MRSPCKNISRSPSGADFAIARYRHPLVMFGIDQSAFVVTPGRNAGAQLITFIQTPVLCQTQYATSLGRVAAHSLDRCD